MARPIQKRLLIHSGVLVTGGTNDIWQNTSGTTEVNLENIRFDNTDKIVKSPSNVERKLTAIMFFDVKNSKPKGQVFEKNQIIKFQTEFLPLAERRIETIEEVYDGKKLHHYEIGVV